MSMEQNYDKKYWMDKPCPRVDCRKKCKCGLTYISIPAALAEKNPPVNGAFCNAIVKYEDTGEVWIFSQEGIPVLIKEGNAS